MYTDKFFKEEFYKYILLYGFWICYFIFWNEDLDIIDYLLGDMRYDIEHSIFWKLN